MRSLNETKYASIKKYVSEYFNEYGSSPTLAEIVKGTGLPQTTVYRYTSAMIDRGEFEVTGRKSIAPTNAKAPVASIPLLGRVACGIPKYAEENIEEYVRLPISLVGRGEFFMLRADGESMIEAGIDNDDLVVIRKQATVEPGQIVVALVDDEATLKRFYPEPENHRIRLHPENKTMHDYYYDSCEIQGVAIRVIKDLEQ